MTFDRDEHIHIVGVGGAGMSGVARLLLGRGCVVSGSDMNDSPTLEALREAGATITIGHDSTNGAGATTVLWSPAVSTDHVELEAARVAGARLMTRSMLMATLGTLYDVVGLTGTHGKTTATSMMAHVMAAAGRDAGRLLGTDVRGVGANGEAGSTGQLVVEVDESYGTFATLHPAALGLLNVEADHLDHYGDLESLEGAFVALVERTAGPVVVWNDDPGAARVASRTARRVRTVGRLGGDWLVTDEELSRDGARFTVTCPSTLSIVLAVTGAHNVANAAVVAVLALELGIAAEAVAAGLRAFTGAPRRFERHGQWRGMDVIEDYAHLPGEIAATIACARDLGYQRIACVFQPHRVTRTLSVGDDFAPAFDGADVVVVTDLYTAGEANPTGVTGERVASPLRQRRDGVHFAPSFTQAITVLSSVDADALLVLGAGDIGTIINDLPGRTS